MKPSGQLTRTVPLQRKTRLIGDPAKDRERRHRSMLAVLEQRRAVGSRTLPVQRRKPSREQGQQPRKRPSRAGEKTARKLVYARSKGWCEIGIPQLCTQIATEWHHRKLKGQGGKWCPGNGLHGCSPCHGAVTNTRGRRPEYVTAGWLVSASVTRPATVKVHRWDHATQTRVWVLLGVKGGCKPVGEGS